MARKVFVAILVLIISVVVILAVILGTQTPTETVVAGVVPGNVFTYDLKAYTTINDPTNSNVTIPPAVSAYNATEWYRVTITSVSGPEVSFNTTWRFTNGTEIESAFKINLLTGVNNPPFWTMYVANLSLNSLVRPQGSDGLIVNETEGRAYKNSSRATNIILLQNENVDVADPTLSRTYEDYLYVHFDKITGMLVELRNIQLYSDPQVILTYVSELEDSNVWAVS